MGIVIKDCIQMDDGRSLCWDKDDGRAYVVDLKKEPATERNVTSREWMALTNLLGNQLK